MSEDFPHAQAHPRLLWLADILPPPWGGELAALTARAAGSEELRLRVGASIALRTAGRWLRGRRPLTHDCLEGLLLRLCDGAIYAHRETLCQGYVTLRDGCRVGVCGRATIEGGVIRTVSDVSSLCLRLPGPLPSGAAELAEQLVTLLDADAGCRSLLICAPPGAGKTTLLRALARRLALPPRPRQTAVVDSRGELTPHLAAVGGTLDLLTGYPRRAGIDIALRTLGAEIILCDEIGQAADAEAILDAHACGVPIVATAHGRDAAELAARPTLRPLFAEGVFGHIVILDRRPGETACRLRVTSL